MKKRELQTSLTQRMTTQSNHYHLSIKTASTVEAGVRRWGDDIRQKRIRTS